MKLWLYDPCKWSFLWLGIALLDNLLSLQHNLCISFSSALSTTSILLNCEQLSNTTQIFLLPFDKVTTIPQNSIHLRKFTLLPPRSQLTAFAASKNALDYADHSLMTMLLEERLNSEYTRSTLRQLHSDLFNKLYEYTHEKSIEAPSLNDMSPEAHVFLRENNRAENLHQQSLPNTSLFGDILFFS